MVFNLLIQNGLLIGNCMVIWIVKLLFCFSKIINGYSVLCMLQLAMICNIIVTKTFQVCVFQGKGIQNES